MSDKKRGMRVDWKEGRWRLWDIDNDALVGEFTAVYICVPSELILDQGGRRGWMVVYGAIRRFKNDSAIIE